MYSTGRFDRVIQSSVFCVFICCLKYNGLLLEFLSVLGTAVMMMNSLHPRSPRLLPKCGFQQHQQYPHHSLLLSVQLLCHHSPLLSPVCHHSQSILPVHRHSLLLLPVRHLSPLILPVRHLSPLILPVHRHSLLHSPVRQHSSLLHQHSLLHSFQQHHLDIYRSLLMLLFLHQLHL